MTITRYRELKTITSANEISERAQFYSKEYDNYSYRQFMGSKDAAEKALASKRSKLKKAYAEATIDIFRRITEV